MHAPCVVHAYAWYMRIMHSTCVVHAWYMCVACIIHVHGMCGTCTLHAWYIYTYHVCTYMPYNTMYNYNTHTVTTKVNNDMI